MATQTIEFRSPPSQTVTAKLFAVGSDTQVDSQSATEATNRKGTYAAAYTDVAAGEYELIAFVGAVPVARWFVTLTLTTATFQTYDKVRAALDSAATAAIADAVLTESILDHRNVANSLAKFIWQIRQANLTIDGTVSNAITPTTLTFSSNVVATTSAYAHAVLLFTTGPLAGENSPIISYNSTNGVFLLEEPLTAAPSNGDEFVVIAGSHVHSVADIQSGLATSAALAAAKAILDKVDTGLVVDGAVYQFTANMLELGPAGGTATVAVLPATGIVADRTAGTTLTPVVGETISQSITLYQTDGTTAVSLSGKTLKIIFETMSGVDVAVVLAADITISGASSNVVTFAYPSAVTASERTLRFAIRDAAAPLTMYLQGVCSVIAAPKVDA